MTTTAKANHNHPQQQLLLLLTTTTTPGGGGQQTSGGAAAATTPGTTGDAAAANAGSYATSSNPQQPSSYEPDLSMPPSAGDDDGGDGDCAATAKYVEADISNFDGDINIGGGGGLRRSESALFPIDVQSKAEDLESPLLLTRENENAAPFVYKGLKRDPSFIAPRYRAAYPRNSLLLLPSLNRSYVFVFSIVRLALLLVFLSAELTFTGAAPDDPSSLPTSYYGVTLSVQTSAPCTDTLGYVDEQSYGCASQEGYACVEYSELYDYTAAGVLDLLLNCPFTCDMLLNPPLNLKVCGPARPSIRLVAVGGEGEGETPSYGPGTTPLDEGEEWLEGPPFSAIPEDVVQYDLYLPFPGCFQVQVNAGDENKLLARVNYEIKSIDGEATKVGHLVDSASQPRGPAISEDEVFCISNCIPPLSYDPTEGVCSLCKSGFTRNDYGYCQPCPRGTFWIAGELEQLCRPCPDEKPYSEEASSDEGACLNLGWSSLYGVSVTNRIFAFSQDADEFESIVDEDGTLNWPQDLVFISPYIIVATSYDGNAVVVYNFDGEYLGTLAEITGPTGILFYEEDGTLLVISYITGMLHFFNVTEAITINSDSAVIVITSDPFKIVSAMIPAVDSLGLVDKYPGEFADFKQVQVPHAKTNSKSLLPLAILLPPMSFPTSLCSEGCKRR